MQRQTRARSRMPNAVPLMAGLDKRGLPSEPLPPEANNKLYDGAVKLDLQHSLRNARRNEAREKRLRRQKQRLDREQATPRQQQLPEPHVRREVPEDNIGPRSESGLTRSIKQESSQELGPVLDATQVPEADTDPSPKRGSETEAEAAITHACANHPQLENSQDGEIPQAQREPDCGVSPVQPQPHGDSASSEEEDKRPDPSLGANAHPLRTPLSNPIPHPNSAFSSSVERIETDIYRFILGDIQSRKRRRDEEENADTETPSSKKRRVKGGRDDDDENMKDESVRQILEEATAALSSHQGEEGLEKEETVEQLETQDASAAPGDSHAPSYTPSQDPPKVGGFDMKTIAGDWSFDLVLRDHRGPDENLAVQSADSNG